MAQTGRTAREVVDAHGPTDQVDLDAQAAADAAGVQSAEFIDYDVHLAAYEQRSDVENMATRLTRDIGPDFAAADWARAVDANTDAPVLSTGAPAYVDIAPAGAGAEDVQEGDGPVATWPPA